MPQARANDRGVASYISSCDIQHPRLEADISNINLNSFIANMGLSAGTQPARMGLTGNTKHDISFKTNSICEVVEFLQGQYRSAVHFLFFVVRESLDFPIRRSHILQKLLRSFVKSSLLLEQNGFPSHSRYVSILLFLPSKRSFLL